MDFGSDALSSPLSWAAFDGSIVIAYGCVSTPSISVVSPEASNLVIASYVDSDASKSAAINAQSSAYIVNISEIT